MGVNVTNICPVKTPVTVCQCSLHTVKEITTLTTSNPLRYKKIFVNKRCQRVTGLIFSSFLTKCSPSTYMSHPKPGFPPSSAQIPELQPCKHPGSSCTAAEAPPKGDRFSGCQRHKESVHPAHDYFAGVFLVGLIFFLREREFARVQTKGAGRSQKFPLTATVQLHFIL